jgi:DNA-directed RNA polymerase specialized sigma24 family protein
MTLAEDVTQRVFLGLAQHSARLDDRTSVTGWLHETTRNLAIKTVRSEERRRQREQEAAAMNHPDTNDSEILWELIAPRLDEALDCAMNLADPPDAYRVLSERDQEPDAATMTAQFQKLAGAQERSFILPRSRRRLAAGDTVRNSGKTAQRPQQSGASDCCRQPTFALTW